MGRPRRLDHGQVVVLCQQGESVEEIARRLGCSARTVRQILKQSGVHTIRRHGSVDHDRVISRYIEGASIECVAEEVGCSKAGVFHVLRANNIPTRTGAKRRDIECRLGFEPTAEWLNDQLAVHKTASAVASAHKIPYMTLISCMDRLGVDRPKWRGGPGPAGHPLRQESPIKEAIELSNRGVTYTELADRYDVSYGVIMRRMKDAGHVSPKNKQTKYPQFAHIQGPKRRVLNALGIAECQICGEHRAVDYCHIVPASEGGPVSEDNCLVLCPTHHRLFDRDLLISCEKKEIVKIVNRAQRLYGSY